MLGQYAAIGASSSDSRIFVYEVTGLQQNDATEGHQSPIRSSASQFMQVPAYRMNETMQRITRMGGKIVSIRSISDPMPTAASAEPAAEDESEDDANKHKRR